MPAASPPLAATPDDVLEFAYASPGTDVLAAYGSSDQGQVRLTPAEQRHIGAGASEAQRDAAAQTAGRARDDGGSSAQPVLRGAHD